MMRTFSEVHVLLKGKPENTDIAVAAPARSSRCESETVVTNAVNALNVTVLLSVAQTRSLNLEVSFPEPLVEE